MAHRVYAGACSIRRRTWRGRACLRSAMINGRSDSFICSNNNKNNNNQRRLLQPLFPSTVAATVATVIFEIHPKHSVVNIRLQCFCKNHRNQLQGLNARCNLHCNSLQRSVATSCSDSYIVYSSCIKRDLFFSGFVRQTDKLLLSCTFHCCCELCVAAEYYFYIFVNFIWIYNSHRIGIG